MKKTRILIQLFTFCLASLLLWSCQEDEVSPFVEGFEIEDNDLLQVTDANPNITVSFTASSSNMNRVDLNIISTESADNVYSSTLSNISANTLNRVDLSVPFPTPDIAPSGEYKVQIAINGQTSGSNFIEYNINVLNNREVQYCEFPDVPSGKVGLFVSIPGGEAITEAGMDVFIVGDFMEKNGADGNWNPGNPDFKLTKLSDQCYYIFLDQFDSGDNFKFTLGDWPMEFLGPNGEALPNQIHAGGNLNTIVYNFKTLPVVEYEVPEVLPSNVVETGKITVVAEVGSDENAPTYFLVEKGATTLDGAIEMTTLDSNPNKVAAAVPKTGAEYIVIKDSLDNPGVNGFGFPTSINVDLSENPVRATIGTFKQQAPNIENLFLVGGATPGGWNNPVPVPDQQLTEIEEGKYEITIELAASDGYLLLPVNGSWDTKVGVGGQNTPLEGDLAFQGGDFVSPEEAGTYKMEVDLVNGRYKLTKQ